MKNLCFGLLLFSFLSSPGKLVCQTGNVILSIRDKTGMAIKNASVNVYNKDDFLEFQGVTDEDGKVEILNQPFGFELFIEVSYKNCFRKDTTITVSEEPSKRRIFLVLDCESDSGGCFEFTNWEGYVEYHRWLTIGVGGAFGYRPGNPVALDIIPSNLRMGRPHPDDLDGIPKCIFNPTIPDSYLIDPNRVDLTLFDRFSFDIVNISIKGLINFSLRSSPTGRETPEIDPLNFHRENYIIDSCGFDAFIYYSVRTKKNPVNLSAPVYVTLPVLTLGCNNKAYLRARLGMNLIRPKVSLEAIKGWDRYGEHTPDVRIDIGKIRESEYFAGFDLETSRVAYGFQVGLVDNKYVASNERYNSIEFKSDLHLAYWLYISYVLNNKN